MGGTWLLMSLRSFLWFVGISGGFLLYILEAGGCWWCVRGFYCCVFL